MKSPSIAALLSLSGLGASALAQTTFSEIEPNETKALATPVVGMVAGDSLTGNSIGSVATPGPDSVDVFRIKTALFPPGIYRHRLFLTTGGAAGHVGTLRGRTQTSGVPNTTSDTTLQTSSGGSIPSRFNQWYGFGKEEEMYYRVSGLVKTTADYIATLETAPITPIAIPTSFAPGSLTITTVGQTGATQVDTDLWVYDSTFTAIVGCGNDDEAAPGTSRGSKLTRTFTAGTYYLAITNYNLSNNLGSPVDDSSRTGAVTDFPNAVVNSSVTGSSTTPLNISFRITDSALADVLTTAAKAAPYEVVWYQLSVGITPPTCYANCDASTNAPILNVNDFNCFLNAFAAASSYANCDNSTNVPILNVNDFNCFLNAFAAGCP